MKYVKKPIVVDAFQFGVEDVLEWFLEEKQAGLIEVIWHDNLIDMKECFIKTLEGTMSAVSGDMIIKGIQGEIYPCKKDIFDATYDVYEEVVDSDVINPNTLVLKPGAFIPVRRK
jgi:hypothetical protein